MRGFVKNISFLCILFLVFSLFACSSTTTAGKSNSETQKQTSQSVKAKAKQKNTVTLQPSKTTSSANKNAAQTSTSTQNSTSSEAVASSTQASGTSTSTVSKSTSNTSTTKTNVTTTVKTTTINPASQPAKPSSPPANEQPALTVTLSITGPKDYPSILPATKVAYKEGDTVYTVLSREAKLSNILIGSKGSGATLYIQGLEDKSGKWSFYEFDYGAKSGWIFKVNGAEITRSAGITSVKAGDRIECIYVQ